jgi:DegV family protein with EDD domain
MIAIVTDSTSDIPRNVITETGITVIPAIVIIGGEAFKDGEKLSRTDFYKQLPGMTDLPTTAAPASGVFEAAYAALFEQGADEIISIHAASKLSAIYNAAWIAAKSFARKVHVVDSEQISLGLGFQVLAAYDAVKNGDSVAEAITRIQDTRNRIKVIAMVDTLEYLRRSGRVSGVRAKVGVLLKMRVFVELKAGEVLRIDQIRTRSKAIAQLGDMITNMGPLACLAVLHTNAETDARRLLQDYAPSYAPAAMVVNVTTVIGTHVGPNALGFAAVGLK